MLVHLLHRADESNTALWKETVCYTDCLHSHDSECITDQRAFNTEVTCIVNISQKSHSDSAAISLSEPEQRFPDRTDFHFTQCTDNVLPCYFECYWWKNPQCKAWGEQDLYQMFEVQLSLFGKNKKNQANKKTTWTMQIHPYWRKYLLAAIYS